MCLDFGLDRTLAQWQATLFQIFFLNTSARKSLSSRTLQWFVHPTAFTKHILVVNAVKKKATSVISYCSST